MVGSHKPHICIFTHIPVVIIITIIMIIIIIIIIIIIMMMMRVFLEHFSM